MSLDTITRDVAAQFTGEKFDPIDLRNIIEASMTNQPRSLQKRIGPSELGMGCTRCLAHKLAGTPERTEAAWLPYIGTAVHEQLEHVFIQHEQTRIALGMPGRYLPECRVTVGQVDGVDITGSTDLFDTHTGTVIDWKIVGTNTLRKAKARGASDQYRTQAMLYGRGWESAGYQVTGVAIYFLPRNAVSLRDGYAWQATYSPRLADEALDRATRLSAAIRTIGAKAVIDAQPEHDGDGFTCKRYGDYAPTPPPGTSGDPFG